MKLCQNSFDFLKPVEITDKSIVDILTSTNERSLIRQYYHEGEEQRTRPFAVNYAWKRGDLAPVLRGFEFEGKLYEIDVDSKSILVQPRVGHLFYDQDKIDSNRFEFEGNLDEFINEFIKSGYQIKNK